MKGYLTEVQFQELNNLISQLLVDVYYHYWVKNDFRSLDWIEFVFTNNRKLCLTSGDLAEDIKVVDFSKDITTLQGEYELKSISVIESKDWQKFKNQILLDYEVTDTGYCNGSIILHFGVKKVEIFAVMDNVNAKFLI